MGGFARSAQRGADPLGRAVALLEQGEPSEREGGAEPRMRRWRCVLGARYAGRLTEESLDLVEKDRGESRDGLGAVGEKQAQSLGHLNHPLPDGDGRDDAVHQMRGCLRPAAAVGRRGDAASLAGEADQEPVVAACAAGAGEAEAADAVLEVCPEPLLDVARGRADRRARSRRASSRGAG